MSSIVGTLNTRVASAMSMKVDMGLRQTMHFKSSIYLWWYSWALCLSSYNNLPLSFSLSSTKRVCCTWRKCKWVYSIRNQPINFEKCEWCAHAFDTPKIMMQFKRRSTATKHIVWEPLYSKIFFHLGPSWALLPWSLPLSWQWHLCHSQIHNYWR